MPKGSARAKYPWDAWFDGEVHVLRRGHDFDVAAHHFQDRVHHTGQLRGVAVATRRLGDVVLIQGVSPHPSGSKVAA